MLFNMFARADKPVPVFPVLKNEQVIFDENAESFCLDGQKILYDNVLECFLNYTGDQSIEIILKINTRDKAFFASNYKVLGFGVDQGGYEALLKIIDRFSLGQTAIDKHEVQPDLFRNSYYAEPWPVNEI